MSTHPLDRRALRWLAVALQNGRKGGGAVRWPPVGDWPSELVSLEAELVAIMSQSAPNVTTTVDVRTSGAHPDDVLLTPKQVAARLELSTTTVRRRIKDGTLRTVQFGPRRFVRSGDLPRAI